MPAEILGLWNSANGPEKNPVVRASSPTNMIIFGTTGKPLRISMNPKNPLPLEPSVITKSFAAASAVSSVSNAAPRTRFSHYFVAEPFGRYGVGPGGLEPPT